MNTINTIDKQLIAFILFILLAIVFHYVSIRVRKLILAKSNASHRIKYYNTLLTLLWLIYSIFLYNRYSVYDSRIFWILVIIFILIFLFFFWFIIREIIAGISTRMSFKIKKGQTIQFDQMQAEINGIHLTSLELLKANGNLYLVPWTKIINQSLEIVSVNESKNMFERRVQIPKTLSFDELKKRLNYEIIIFPGSIASKTPIITLIDNTTVYDISLTLFTIDKSSFDELIDKIENLKF